MAEQHWFACPSQETPPLIQFLSLSLTTHLTHKLKGFAAPQSIYDWQNMQIHTFHRRFHGMQVVTSIKLHIMCILKPITIKRILQYKPPLLLTHTHTHTAKPRWCEKSIFRQLTAQIHENAFVFLSRVITRGQNCSAGWTCTVDKSRDWQGEELFWV